MKKWLKITSVVLVVIIAIVLLGLGLAGGAIIKGSVNSFGPMVLGVPVTLQKAVFMPFRGKVQLTKLHIGNPEGFKTPGLFELGDVDIEIDVRSLISDTIVIHKIIVDSPEITYERGLLDSNFGKLLANLQSESNKPQKTKGSKKVIIEKLVVRNPKLKMSVTAVGGHAVPIALGQVELMDIGKESGGVTVVDALKIFLSVITSNIQNAISGAGDTVGSGAKAMGHGAATAGEAVVGGAASAIKGVGGFIGLGNKEK